MRTIPALAYQGAAAAGATHVGLLVLVYDSLSADLVRAADAVRKGDIQLRCSSSGHALLLLGHLESWLDTMDDTSLAASLRVFYAMVRTRTIQLQATPVAEQFEDLANMITETRAVWQVKERSAFAEGFGPRTEDPIQSQWPTNTSKLRFEA